MVAFLLAVLYIIFDLYGDGIHLRKVRISGEILLG